MDYPGDRTCARLDLRVAIRAQQYALADLRTKSVEAPRHPASRDSELLLARIDVVELERGRRPVVTAQSTRPARLLHEDLLHASATTNDSLCTARTAAEVAPTVSDVTDFTMSRAREKDF
jgi:hypothetical protein